MADHKKKKEDEANDLAEQSIVAEAVNERSTQWAGVEDLAENVDPVVQ
jgi:hypothetical protein